MDRTHQNSGSATLKNAFFQGSVSVLAAFPDVSGLAIRGLKIRKNCRISVYRIQKIN
jgi:hypothetical protein